MRRYIPQLLPDFAPDSSSRSSWSWRIALGLMVATLPRLLDGYFAAAVDSTTCSRAHGRRQAARREPAAQYQNRRSAAAASRSCGPTEPLSAADGFATALGNADERLPADDSRRTSPQANVTVTIAHDPEHADRMSPTSSRYRCLMSSARPGQQREPILASSGQLQHPGPRSGHRAGAGSPDRLVTVTLSHPFTFRAQTLETIAGVMSVAAAHRAADRRRHRRRSSSPTA